MMISPVCFSGYYIMSADHLETSYPHESAKGLKSLPRHSGEGGPRKRWKGRLERLPQNLRLTFAGERNIIDK